MNEAFVEKAVRKFLEYEEWELTNPPKGLGEHGTDIRARHREWGKTYIIEAKGETKSHKNQNKHLAFYILLGQILSRMSREGNSNNRGIRYGIAIPKDWENTFRKKISKMEFGWKLLKLHVFLVENNGDVLPKTYRYFLKKN